jgi:prepilin-type N-terminal cleavage/methylation domain-containing protein
MKRNLTKGFTLVELLVVIAIIGILASVVLVSLNSARSKARDSRRVSDMNQIRLALEAFYDDNQDYPDALTDLDPNYIPQIPSDPQTGTPYGATNYDNCGTGDQDYTLQVTLENNNRQVLDSDVDEATILCGSVANCNDAASPYGYCLQP